MKTDSYKRATLSEPCDLREAYDQFYLLTSEVNAIESQLLDSSRSQKFEERETYKQWRQKANMALSMKLKQIESLKKWIYDHKGQVPTEEYDNVKPENMSIGKNIRISAERRPDPDKVIDNLCGAVMQMRSLKKRLHPLYKIANAAYDLAQEIGIDTDDPKDVLNQLVYWLDKAGYNVQEIPGFNQLLPHNDDEDDWENGA